MDWPSSVIDRFWSRVSVRSKDECWPWLGYVNSDGYGRFRPGGRQIPKMQAHRFAFECTGGVIPPGMLLRHSCDNPSCCNPGHLLPGTHTENMQDKVARGRTPDQRGDRNANSKLTDAQVLEIRSSTDEGIWLARKYGVAKSTISEIRNGKSRGLISKGEVAFPDPSLRLQARAPYGDNSETGKDFAVRG